MAFVFQAKKNDTLEMNKLTQLGPGSYLGQTTYKSKHSYAPFNSTTEKAANIKPKKEESKKMSSLNNSLDFSNKEKVLAHFIDENIKVVEAPKMSTVFKSKSTRFQKEIHSDVPGPGSYDVLNGVMSKSKPFHHQEDKKNIIFDIFETYQKVPSIPGKLHEMGYNDDEESTLKLNPITINYTGTQKDCPGPGEYDLRGIFDNKKGPSFGPLHNIPNNKNSNKSKKKDQKNIGPGTYNPKKEYNPLYKYKSSSAFASGSKRAFGAVPGEKAKNFLMKKVEEKLKLQKLLNPDSENDEIIILHDNEPGPGAYYNQAAFSSIHVKTKPFEHQFFGSRASRFENSFSVTTKDSSHIGPGSYSHSSLRSGQNKQTKTSSTPFLVNEKRFKNTNINNFPSPLDYIPKTSVHFHS